VEGIKFRTRAEGLRILSEKHLGCGRRVYDNHRDVSQLDLVHGSVGLGPEAILFGGVCADLGEVSYQRQTARALEAGHTGRRPDELVDDDIDDRDKESGDS
jgi:hypothetical protein